MRWADTGESNRPWWIAGAIGIVLVTVLMGIRWWTIAEQRGEEPEGGGVRVAVVPLEVVGGETERAQADLFARAVARHLGGAPGVRLIPAALFERSRSRDPREVGAELGADVVLAGELRATGTAGEIELALQLVAVADGTALWSETYRRDLTELPPLADEVAERILTELVSNVPPPT